MSNTTLVKGSLSQIAKETGRTLAESWLGVDAVILVDISLSMSDCDARNGMTRHEVAQEELIDLQKRVPGKVAIIAFSNDCEFLPNGYLPRPRETTNLTGALEYVRVADAIPDMHFIVISDGEPNDESSALSEARKFRNKIDTIYVGPESGRAGREFLQKLAKASGGEFLIKPKVAELANGIFGLLGA